MTRFAESALDAVTAVLLLGVLVATYIIGCLWLQRSHRFVRTVHPGYHLRHTAVGVWICWLIPVFSLWLPRQVVEDIRLGTPAEDRRVRSTGPWWAAWILAVIVGDGVALVAGNASYYELQPAVPYLQIARAVLLCLACVMWVHIIREVTDDQLAHRVCSSNG